MMDANRKSNLVTCGIIILILVLTGCIDSFESIRIQTDKDKTNDNSSSNDSITIACWNLQIFGKSKASNESLLSFYHEKLSIYDIFIIQEIRDASGTAIQTLADRFNDHECILSQRAGKTSSKEQYAIFYNEKITLLNQFDYTEEYQIYVNRPPLSATFKSNNLTFTLFTIHTDPDDVEAELSILESITLNATLDTIIIGDLNADGSYYNEDNKQHYPTWNWVIPDTLDTTVATSNNTYDRIIINNKMDNNFIRYGVMNDVEKAQSDHYLIYAEFNTSDT
jgi:deoxyribonuclease-1-like protein